MKLEYTPVNDFQKFNFLGKRLFDYLNTKINITTGNYIGDGNGPREILVDIIPRCVVIFSNDVTDPPVIWIDIFTVLNSKRFDGANLVDAILGYTIKKNAFLIGADPSVNAPGIKFNFMVLGD